MHGYPAGVRIKDLKSCTDCWQRCRSAFSTWFDALDYMCGECEKIDFDIALLGCGAYGYPLAAHIKKWANRLSISVVVCRYCLV